MTRDKLPNDFYRRLSPKKEALLQVLLDADGEWIRGVDIRQRMREEHGLSVPHKPGAIAIHLSHYTQWYSEEFRRDLIPGRWAEDSHNHAEFRIGRKYEDELREWFSDETAADELDRAATEAEWLVYDEDVRQDLTDGRRRNFKQGWTRAVRGREYEDTLEQLTWNNLGWRLGKLFGETSDDLREELLEWCANQRLAVDSG